MHVWHWMNDNSGALQSLAATVGLLLTGITIAVLLVTRRAIQEQAKEARSLTTAANEQITVAKAQTISFTNQALAAQDAATATERANKLAEESNRLMSEQLLADLRPILVYTQSFDATTLMTHDAVKNVGRGPAVDVQIALGVAKDAMPGEYIQSRTVIGINDDIPISINPKFLQTAAITIRYDSLDGRRFTTTFYRCGDSVKHDFLEFRKVDGEFRQHAA
jgi:hypothetical protein